jgi:hypothetical protein
LLDLLAQWQRTTDGVEKERIWHQMLAINAERQFSIGVTARPAP